MTTRRVDITRNDALRMEVVPYLEENTRTVYEMIAEGWHPADVAKAYGFLVEGRELARILDSPLWTTFRKRRYSRHNRKLQTFPIGHTYGWRYSQQDKEDAVWLIEHGWHAVDVAVMTGTTVLPFSKRKTSRTSLYQNINRWVKELHDDVSS